MTIDWVVCDLMTIPQQCLTRGEWQHLAGRDVTLRCWWSASCGTNGRRERAVLVLPEVFGVNAWVRSVADRLAAAGVSALAMPLFARTAPELDLPYDPESLAQGRTHKERTTAHEILADVSTAVAWLRSQGYGQITVVGFCFGGHAALLAATLPDVQSSFDFYGAGITQGRPGGGAPSLELLAEVDGTLTCVCGTADPLIPESEQRQIAAALKTHDPSGERLRYVPMEGADHGFMCEARSSYHPTAAEQGWQLLMNELLAEG